MNNRYRKTCLKAAAVAGLVWLGYLASYGQLDSGDLLIADAGNDRVLQFDASSGTISVAVTQSALVTANGGTSPSLSGEVFYDTHQSYLYLSGTAGSNRLYQADIGTGVVSLATQSALLGLQAAPEALVDLTGKATPLDEAILIADRGVTAGSLYRINRLNASKTLQATEQDFITFSGGSGIGMTDLDFAALTYNPGASEYLLLSGGNGLDGSSNVRSVLYKTDTDGQPLTEFVVSAINADWQAMGQDTGGTVYILQDLSGSVSVLSINGAGVPTEIMNQAALDTIFGGPVSLAPSLALDATDRILLMALDGTVYRINPANPLGDNSLVVAAQDYIDDTGTAVTTALGLDAVPAAPVSYTVTESSDPAGYVTVTATSVIENRPYTVSNPNIVQGNFRLGFWTLNGVRQASASGRGLLRPTFTVTEDTEAVAQYYDINIDGDGDRLGDWWEFWMFGDRTRGPQDDDDLDGFDHETEFNYGYDATVTDTARPGGIAGRQSATINYLDTGAFRYTIKSDPFGILQVQEGLLTPGQSVTTPYLLGDAIGHTFVGWEVDGVPVTSPEGVYLNQITVTPAADTEIVALYVLSGLDSEPDGIVDSYELQQFGNLGFAGSDDPDGDGFDIDYEIANGLSPIFDDTVRAGGIAARQSALITFAVGKSLYTEDSIPLGIIPSVSEFVDNGTIKTTAYYGTSLVSGLEFAYWSVNGTAVRDPSGIARRENTTTVAGPTDVRAHFFSPTQDSENSGAGDGIDDVDEWRYFGTLANDRTSDPDADTFTIGEELDNGFSLTTDDEVRVGGIAARQSVLIKFNDSNKVLLTTRSEPFGLIPFTEVYYDPGTQITSAHYTFTQVIGGHYFTHWTVNGVRVEDPTAIARRQTIFDITADTELVAHFTLTTADTDSDGILDYRELRIVDDPTLATVAPGSDLDGDGFTVAEEQANGYSEVLDDTILVGGVSARQSILVSVNLDIGPFALELDNATIEEGQPVGTAVGDFVTSSANPNDTFTYALIPGLGSDDNARFTIDGETLKSDEIFDYDLDQVLSVRVRVTDTRGNTFEQILLVFVEEDIISTYPEFAEATFTPAQLADPLISGPDVDIEGDGLTNFEEYVHGKDPFSPDGDCFLIIAYDEGTLVTNRDADFTFPWRDGMEDADYEIEQSLGLSGWGTVPHVEFGGTVQDGIRQLAVTVSQMPPHPDEEFFRLKIIVIPLP